MYSTTQGGNLVVLAGFIAMILQKIGVNIGSEELTQFLSAAAIAVGFAISWYGRWKKGDITIAGFKKTE